MAMSLRGKRRLDQAFVLVVSVLVVLVLVVIATRQLAKSITEAKSAPSLVTSVAKGPDARAELPATNEDNKLLKRENELLRQQLKASAEALAGNQMVMKVLEAGSNSSSEIHILTGPAVLVRALQGDSAKQVDPAPTPKPASSATTKEQEAEAERLTSLAFIKMKVATDAASLAAQARAEVGR